MEFCKEIGISISKANTQIRIYEDLNYSTEDRKNLIEKGLNNWRKMQTYLGLDDEGKEEILEKIEK
jgi:hypothetical protein